MHPCRVLAVALAVCSPAAAQLNQLAVAAGFKYFGTAVDNPGLNNQAYMNIATNKNEFGQVTPANGQKWDSTERSQGQFSYANGDAVTNRARQAGQILRCHALVWHSQLPSWVNNINGRDAMTRVIQTHVQNVAGHYKGQCYAWDVVNEALEDSGAYRNSPMYRALGKDFLTIAFQAAAAADPAAKLYYNDYNIENPGAKYSEALNIVRNLKSAGARIDGVGLQAHFIVGQTPSLANLKTALNGFAALVDEVAYTELDIRHPRLPASDADRQQQSRDYQTVAQACLDTPNCVGITVWDFADQYSWVPQTFPGQGDACLWNSNLQKKPAYTGLVNLFSSAAASRTSTATSTTRPVTSSSATSARTISTIKSYVTQTATITQPPVSTSARTSIVTVIVTSWTSTVVTVTDIDTVIETVTQWVPPSPTSTSTTSRTSSSTSRSTTQPPAPEPTQTKYGQCGGSGYSGATKCAAGSSCSAVSPPWYYQCL
ncbi:putative endo-1,4-beta-xylanase [Colletotrichum plurivorum]|uniref:Beta-xylanase n=1 Tax=Colletotrichum plurivorum TaxID=2175906 RepID=A0A8H6NHE5_9PEZI|nr:putative endo-1,4-beta-xylanase [Colletotrichum plurivorum]